MPQYNPTDSDISRFWSKVDKSGDCWLWTAHTNKKGFGRIYWGDRHQFAHRISWQLHNGSISTNQRILQTCENKLCVNPDHLYLRHRKDHEARFWRHVEKRGLNQCWNWTAYKLRGYGRMSINDKHMSAHRFSWIIHNGAIPEGLNVLHHCDNPSCVNPRHLWLGTDADNHRDRSEKGRTATGEQAGTSKLTWDEVKEMRRKYATGATSYKKLAKEYKISVSQVCNIILKRQWIE